MRHVTVIGIVIGTFLITGAGTAVAQRGMGRGAGGRGARPYDAKTVTTVSGTVVKVEHIAGRGRGGSGGVHLLLQTDTEEISVHLGPAWYIDKQALKIAAHDSVEVRGSRVTFDGKPAIIAAEVKRGDQKLILRDENGIPVWSRGGR